MTDHHNANHTPAPVTCNENTNNIIIYTGTDSTTRDIIHWLNNNLFCERAFKSPQLWIHGYSDTGKTKLINLLNNVLCIYHVPINDIFYDTYDDHLYDLIVLDDYTNSKPIQWLTSFVQGGTPISIQKIGIEGIKSNNLPVIICSKLTIDECYTLNNCTNNQLTKLKKRFLSLSLNNPIDFNHIFLVCNSNGFVNNI